MPSNELDLIMNGNDSASSPGLDLSMKSSTPSKTMDNLASPTQMMLTGSMVRMGMDHGGLSAPNTFPTNMQRFPKFHEFQCPLCPRSYAQKCSLYRHMKVHKDDKINENEVQANPCSSGEGTFKCPFCIASYTNSASLNVHVRTHAVGYRDMVRKPEDSPHKDDDKLFPCPLCSRVFQRRSRLTVHLNISHRHEQYGDLPKEDDHDADVESDADDMIEPRGRNGSASPESPPTVNDGTEGAFMCHLCGSSYTRRTNLNKHLEKRHNVDPSVLMTISGPDFPTADQLRSVKPPPTTPIKSKISDLAEELKVPGAVFRCPYCDFETSVRYSLYQHMTNTHAEAEDVQDRLMEMVGKEDEEDKMRGHHQNKPSEQKEGEGEIFPCQFCSRVYMRKCNLTQHLKMHFHDEAELKKKRPHMMEEFMNETEENLEDVRQIIEMTKAKDDEKEEVHECAICGLTFGIKVSLILHLKMHERRALNKLKEKEPGEITPMNSPPPPLIRPGMSPPMPGSAGHGPQGKHPAPYVMTQDKDGKTTIHNQQAYMLSHLQVLNQVQHMIMYGRNPLMPPMPGNGLPPSAIPRKRLSTGSTDDENAPKRLRPGPKPGRHWKSLECDPNRRPVKKCSLCSFEIADSKQEGLLQHMAAMHGVSCKLCSDLKFFTKRDFDNHCAQMHSSMCSPGEMEQLMVFGQISSDSGSKVELIDSNDKEGKAENPETRSEAGDDPMKPLKLQVDDDAQKPLFNPAERPFDSYDDGEEAVGSSPMRQVCPKCGLHYAQKSSLNRHIRSHHNYSRVEEMIKAENLGLTPPPSHHVTSGPRKQTPPTLPNKPMDSIPGFLPPLIPMSQMIPGSPMLPPPLMRINNSGVPAQGHLADINPTIVRNLMYGIHNIPPPKLPVVSPPVNNHNRPQTSSRHSPVDFSQSSPVDFSRSSPVNFSRSSSPDDEVGAINLSTGHQGEVQDFSMKTLNNSTSNSPVNGSPSTANKARSRRKPQVVQRIIRNTTLEEEEQDDEGRKSQGQRSEMPEMSSDESCDEYDMTDKNANHIQDSTIEATMA